MKFFGLWVFVIVQLNTAEGQTATTYWHWYSGQFLSNTILNDTPKVQAYIWFLWYSISPHVTCIRPPDGMMIYLWEQR